MIKKLLILTLFSGLTGWAYSQVVPYDSLYYLESVIIGTDTLPNHNIKEIRVFPRKVFSNKREYRRYTRLMINVKKAYPFAIIARNELQIMNDSLKYIHGDKARRQFIKDYEKEMFQRYENDLRKLTFSQGRILLKLVYRELGNTSYNLVKEYRGDVSAIFWQGIARIFGSNLKSTYEPDGEDKDIEEIIMMIDSGMI
ncbi:MAG: DUF4294 domain-containing protein [Bacteroidetes bacterium HGW-Bacteroidetes-4]|jgi:hypothetical protein|nr:MAG: DUF4294 domain-containing protein [Bacteroidetes bacterium HGW-Bacteroidetes-4]